MALTVRVLRSPTAAHLRCCKLPLGATSRRPSQPFECTPIPASGTFAAAIIAQVPLTAKVATASEAVPAVPTPAAAGLGLRQRREAFPATAPDGRSVEAAAACAAYPRALARAATANRFALLWALPPMSPTTSTSSQHCCWQRQRGVRKATCMMYRVLQYAPLIVSARCGRRRVARCTAVALPLTLVVRGSTQAPRRQPGEIPESDPAARTDSDLQG